MAAWKPRDSRLFVEYKIAVGEVTETASEADVGAQQGNDVADAHMLCVVPHIEDW